MKKLQLVLIVSMLLVGYIMQAQCTYDPYQNETKEQRDERMAWWREARFGMFIHWGVYAVPAGTYDGKPIDGIGEWIMIRGQIPVKPAGMRKRVITSKHHD